MTGGLCFLYVRAAHTWAQRRVWSLLSDGLSDGHWRFWLSHAAVGLLSWVKSSRVQAAGMSRGSTALSLSKDQTLRWYLQSCV